MKMMKGGNGMKKNNSSKIAGKTFEPSDYNSENQLEMGLAQTHEQASDGYYEGTIDQELEKND
jgi:hypothetical protein